MALKASDSQFVLSFCAGSTTTILATLESLTPKHMTETLRSVDQKVSTQL